MWQHVILVEKDSQKRLLMIQISKVIDPCHFTGKDRGGSQSMYNLRFNLTKFLYSQWVKLRLLFDNK